MSPFFKKKLSQSMIEKWAQYSVSQIMSDEGHLLRVAFYDGIKDEIPELASIPIDIFLPECQGAQLELLGLAAVKTNRKFGEEVIIEIFQSIKGLQEDLKDSVDSAYSSANKTVAEFGLRGLSGVLAIATSFADCLGLGENQEFIRKVETEFEGLASVIISDIRQYR